MLDRRFANLVYVIDSIAKKYGLLPTEVLSRATTKDIQIHIHSETYQERQRKSQAGENIGDTMSQSEIAEVYKSWRGE